MPAVETFEFEVVPAGMPEFDVPATVPFEPFVLTVPTLNGVDAAARRAWWSAFHMLGPHGFEPEEFEVFEFAGELRGRLVTMGGFVEVPA